MFIGIGIFAAAAILCIVVGAVVMKRNRGPIDNDFDFDKYEGFDESP
jgi:hypothetical protein